MIPEPTTDPYHTLTHLIDVAAQHQFSDQIIGASRRALDVLRESRPRVLYPEPVERHHRPRLELEQELAAARAQAADAGLTLATLCDLILGENADDRSDDALVRAVGLLLRDLVSLGNDVARLETDNNLWQRRANALLNIARAGVDIIAKPFQVYDGTGKCYHISASEFDALRAAVETYKAMAEKK